MIGNLSSNHLAALIFVPLVLLGFIVFIAIKCSRCSLGWYKRRYNSTGRFGWRKLKERITGSSTDGTESETNVELIHLPPAHLQV